MNVITHSWVYKTTSLYYWSVQLSKLVQNVEYKMLYAPHKFVHSFLQQKSTFTHTPINHSHVGVWDQSLNSIYMSHSHCDDYPRHPCPDYWAIICSIGITKWQSRSLLMVKNTKITTTSKKSLSNRCCCKTLNFIAIKFTNKLFELSYQILYPLQSNKCQKFLLSKIFEPTNI